MTVFPVFKVLWVLQDQLEHVDHQDVLVCPDSQVLKEKLEKKE